MKNKFLGLVAAALLISCRAVAPMSVSGVHTEPNTAITQNLPEDAALNAVIAPYKARLEGLMNAKISHTAVDLNKNGDNSNLGNLLADYTFNGADAWAKKNGIPSIDGAVINIGGIRSTIGAGDILTKHVYEVMPFENEVVIVKMKGTDLQGLFDYYASTQKNNPVSHLYIETDAGLLTKTLINGKNLDPEKIYYIATSDYLAFGGDNMKFFGKGETIGTGIRLRDLFLNSFKNNPEVKADTETRLNFKNKKIKTDE